MSRTRVLLIGLSLATACFNGSGLAGAPCLADEDCGPKLMCLASVCGDGEPTGDGRWPDSPTVYCTDGVDELDACPEPGFTAYGQDGNYQINVPSYEKMDGVVHDSVTGLDWESESSSSEYTRAAAIERCNNLQLGGREWRLPSRLELISLLDFGREIPFAGVQTGTHWTSSDTDDAADGWAVDFLSFFVSNEDKSIQGWALCVSGPPLTSSFEIRTDTIRDALTGLEWQRERADLFVQWTEALAHCEGLELAGAGDWRLPSAKELLTLVRDDQVLVEGLDGVSDNFWTSSPSWPTNTVVTVELPGGTSSSDDASYDNYLRCVRG